MNSKVKYTKELVESAVKKSKSVSDVIRALGLKCSGGNHFYLCRRIKMYGIDTSHFVGCAHNKGKPSIQKRPWQKVLVLKGAYPKEKAASLRRALVESGVEYKCQCGLGDMWNSKKIVLQVDHKNGNPLDNRKLNLRFLCPNCHSQTENHGARNIKP